MDADFQLVAVAFLRSTGGVVRLLLAVDRAGVPLHDGEPMLLVEHRPGRPATEMVVEGPQDLAQSTCDLVSDRAGNELASLIEDAVDELGQLDGSRLLGKSVTLRAPHRCFAM